MMLFFRNFEIYAIDVLFQDFSGMLLFMNFQEPIFVLTWAIFSAFDWLNFTPPPLPPPPLKTSLPMSFPNPTPESTPDSTPGPNHV